GHQHERIAAVDERVNDFVLGWAKRAVAENGMQDVERGHGRTIAGILRASSNQGKLLYLWGALSATLAASCECRTGRWIGTTARLTITGFPCTTSAFPALTAAPTNMRSSTPFWRSTATPKSTSTGSLTKSA